MNLTYLHSVLIGSGMFTPVLILAATFAIYTVMAPADQPLTAAMAFSAIAWIGQLQFPLRSVPQVRQVE
jgi:hypothetical protein